MRVLETEETNTKKITLHAHDRSILGLLCMNVRLPLSKIAQTLRLSRQSVEYRIKTMERAHLLVGSRAVINIRQLGYTSHHFFVELHNTTYEKKFIDRCMDCKEVNALIKYSARITFEVSILAKDTMSARHLFLELIEDMPVQYTPTLLLKNLKSSVLPSLHLDKKVNLKHIRNDPSFSKQFSQESIHYTPDKTDLELLYFLSQDASLSLRTLAHKVHLSPDATSYRIKKLISSKYILEFRPVIDYSQLGLSLHTVLFKLQPCSSEQRTQFTSQLTHSDDVLWATELFGNWDYLTYILTSTPQTLHTILGNLSSSHSVVQSYDVLYAYNEYKYMFMTPGMKAS